MNPLLQLEIMTRQSQDKMLQVDNDTAFFNLEIIKEYQMNKMVSYPYKIIHMFFKNILMVITDKEGERAFVNILRRLFMFEELDEH